MVVASKITTMAVFVTEHYSGCPRQKSKPWLCPPPVTTPDDLIVSFCVGSSSV